MVVMATSPFGLYFFSTFMRIRILGIVPKFQGNMSSYSKVVNKKVVGGHNGPPE